MTRPPDKMKKSLVYGVVLVASVLASSCSTPKKVTYFQDNQAIVNAISVNPIKVRANDKLSIVVKSKDADVSSLFNLPVYTNRVGTSSTSDVNGVTIRNYQPTATDAIAYYTVDGEGNIDFPMLGKLHIADMTRAEIAAYIKGELMGRSLVKDPTVTVEFLNTGINMLGEFHSPGRYDINKDQLNILEAIALAGDLSILARRDNVKVIREENGQFKTYTVDLTNLNEVANSPVFYLQQNDIVYAEPNEMRKRQTTVNGNSALSVSFWISVASLITTAVTTVGVFVK